MAVYLLPYRGYRANYYIRNSTASPLDGAAAAEATASADLATNRFSDAPVSAAASASGDITVTAPTGTSYMWPNYEYHLSHYIIQYAQLDGAVTVASGASAKKWPARAFTGSMAIVAVVSAPLVDTRKIVATLGSSAAAAGDLTIVGLAQYPLAANTPTVINALYAGEPMHVSPLRVVPTPLLPQDTLLPNDDLPPEG